MARDTERLRILTGGVVAWILGVVGVVLYAGTGEQWETSAAGMGRAQRIVALQGGGLRGAIAGLNAEDAHSSKLMQSGFKASLPRLSQLATPAEGLNWLEEIQGKDTTHDLDYIKNLPAGDTSVAGYEGMPKMKGMLPSYNEMSAADALLKSAIDKGTMPADIPPDQIWDGKPYEPSPEFNAKLTEAWAGFHQALGEKKWEKLVEQNCNGVATNCKEVLDANHEGYKTTWDGKEWTQWNGTVGSKLEHDSLLK